MTWCRDLTCRIKETIHVCRTQSMPAFPKGREDNTHLNVYGVRTIAGLAVDAIGKEIPELAKYIRQFDYVVISRR